MSSDPSFPGANPADLAEQQLDVTSEGMDPERSADYSPDLPAGADEADVADQRREVPGWADDEEE